MVEHRHEEKLGDREPQNTEERAARVGVGLWVPEAWPKLQLQVPQLCDLEQDRQASANATPGLWNGQGATSGVMGVMAFHTALGRGQGLNTG